MPGSRETGTYAVFEKVIGETADGVSGRNRDVERKALRHVRSAASIADQDSGKPGRWTRSKLPRSRRLVKRERLLPGMGTLDLPALAHAGRQW